MPTLTIRPVEPQETALLHDFLRRVAQYEHMEDELICSVDDLRRELFERNSAEAVFACEGGEPVGFAVFFHKFSTFQGRRGLFLEDLFVLPEKRGRGYGRALLRHLAALTVERDCARLEWNCLDWNAPSLAFYRSLGATVLGDRTDHRLEGAALRALASG